MEVVKIHSYIRTYAGLANYSQYSKAHIRTLLKMKSTKRV